MDEEIDEINEFVIAEESDWEGASIDLDAEERESQFSDIEDDLNDAVNVNSSATSWTKGVNLTPPTLKTFNNATVNYATQLNFHSTPLQIFQHFFDEDLVKNIIDESNRYVEQVKLVKPQSFTTWTPLTVPEFWLFHTLKMATGLVKKPSVKDYWSTDSFIYTPFFGKTMSRTRFEDIMRSLHFVNNATNKDCAKNRYSKLGRVLPDITEKFGKCITPGQYLTVDETLILFKGRLSFKQYNPKKRARFGIKWFVLVDCETKAVLNIIPYEGKNTKLTYSQKDFGFGGAATLTLLENRFFKDHIVTIDNWFMGPALATTLRSKQTYVLGTVKSNRKFMPKFSNKLQKGDVEFFGSNNGMLVERWADNREVLILNTFLLHEMNDAPIRIPGVEKKKPQTVLLYNQKMGGLDDMDRQIKPYQTIRKSLKWYKKMYFHLMDMTIYNSFRIFKLLQPQSTVVYKEFIRLLMGEIVATYTIVRKPRGRVSHFPQENRLTESSHMPTKTMLNEKQGKFYNYHLCWKKGKRATTAYKCITCEKHLCIRGENSCFQQYHTQKKLPVRKKARVLAERR